MEQHRISVRSKGNIRLHIIKAHQFGQTESRQTQIGQTESGGHLEERLRTGPDIREAIHRLSESEQMEEFMFLGLRRTSGVREQDFRKAFGRKIEDIYG